MDRHIAGVKGYFARRCTLIVVVADSVVFQFVLVSAGSVYHIIESFDMDYVQCGIYARNGVVMWTRTVMCALAHRDRRVYHISRYQVPAGKFMANVNKMYAKGFRFPASVQCMADVPIPLTEWTITEVNTYIEQKIPKLVFVDDGDVALLDKLHALMRPTNATFGAMITRGFFRAWFVSFDEQCRRAMDTVNTVRSEVIRWPREHGETTSLLSATRALAAVHRMIHERQSETDSYFEQGNFLAQAFVQLASPEPLFARVVRPVVFCPTISNSPQLYAVYRFFRRFSSVSLHLELD